MPAFYISNAWWKTPWLTLQLSLRRQYARSNLSNTKGLLRLSFLAKAARNRGVLVKHCVGYVVSLALSNETCFLYTGGHVYTMAYSSFLRGPGEEAHGFSKIGNSSGGQWKPLNVGIQPFPPHNTASRVKALEAEVKRFPLPQNGDLLPKL